jgi:cytochrome P450
MQSVGDVQQSDLQELKWTIRDMLSAGSDTTLAVILWTLILLANHPDWQRRLQDQVTLSISCQ